MANPSLGAVAVIYVLNKVRVIGYCIANSNASWKSIKLSGGIALDSLVWEVRSIKSCGGDIDFHISYATTT